jgi:2-polyprenyl-3-methyl-5-hydroxy-6-metoxy-1,4-benzoquinol methylase
MKAEIVAELLLLNQEFYSRFAAPFADSRSSPQPGFNQLLQHMPDLHDRVLDVGCGNGRFGQFLAAADYAFTYTGIDFTAEFLVLADGNVKGDFYERDISRPGYLDGLEQFDLVVCLATMQHVPGRSNRIAMLREMKLHLAPQGRIFLANWQFLDSPRQRRKIREWAMVGIGDADIELGDFLLSWQREGQGLRYVCAIDEEETAHLASAANLEFVAQYRSDGKEGILNLYTVLTHKS